MNDNRLKQFRMKYGFTQKQAAEELGYRLKTWQHYEQGREIPHYLIKHVGHYTAYRNLLD